MRTTLGLGSLLLLVCGLLTLSATAASGGSVFEGPVPRAQCGPGSLPETGIQGDVSQKDRNSGRSQLGYRCNLVLAGQHQGQGAGWQNAWYDQCDYYDTKTGTGAPADGQAGGGTGNGQTSPGVQVIDMSNPAHPTLTANLDTPAMDGPWESLKVNQPRGLLAGVGGFGSDGDGPLYFDVYDVKSDCTHPKLLSSTPIDIPLGHEGNWSADGMTYYASSLFTGTVAAIDVSNPASPQLIQVFSPVYAQTASTGQPSVFTHGLSTSDDGNLLYTTDFGQAINNGLVILDVSAIQSRAATDAVPPATVGSVGWTDGTAAQVPVPMDYNGHKYVLFVDEGGYGASRIIDVNDPKNPFVVSKLKLAIHMPANQSTAAADSSGDGSFTYTGHYCAVDREHNPTAAACGYFESGIRVFDIRDPYHPREIAYFNPPAQVAKHGTLCGSEHDGCVTSGQPVNDTADWCTSQIRFYNAPDGNSYLWAQCQDNGLMALKFTNGAYPLPPLSGSAPSSSVLAAQTTAAQPAQAGATAPAYGVAPTIPNTSTGPQTAGGNPGEQSTARSAPISAVVYVTPVWIPLAVVIAWLALLLNVGAWRAGLVRRPSQRIR